MKFLTEENYNYILEYKNLKDKPSYSSYCSDKKIDRHTLSKWLEKDLNYDLKKDNKVYFFDEKEKNVIELYRKRKETKMSLTDIKKLTNCDTRKIQKLAKLCNLDMTNYSLKEFNRNAFNNIETEEDAYWLGFITADGYLNEEKKFLVIQLGAKDKKHLEKFCNFMKVPKDEIVNTIKSSYGGVGQLVYYVNFSSKQLVENLKKLKVFQGKSAKEIFNTDIPKNLYSHYMRGYFDGDGCIRKDLKNIGIVSSEQFCFKYKEILEKEITDLYFDKKYKYVNRKQGELFCFVVTDKNKAAKILNFLYKDSKIYLNRKYELYEQFITKYCRG